MKTTQKIAVIGIAILIPLPYVMQFLGITFTSDSIAWIFKLICFLAPLSLWIFLLGLEQPRKSLHKWIVFVPLAASLVLSFFALFVHIQLIQTIFTGTDPSFTRISEIKMGPAYYSTYRTNEGGFPRYGIVVRKESRFGILTSYNTIANRFPAYDAKFYQSGDGWYVDILGGDSAKVKLP